MLKLILLRHAKSAWAQGAQSDFERHLNERGEHDAKMIGQRMSARGIKPGKILSSPATRAKRTSKLVSAELGVSETAISYDRRIYLAEPGDLMAVLRELTVETPEIMVVGHNPGITGFAGRLADAHVDNMPTSSYAEITFELEKWKDVDWETGTLTHFDWPAKTGRTED
jgi:phosphohistidine phosphatase